MRFKTEPSLNLLFAKAVSLCTSHRANKTSFVLTCQQDSQLCSCVLACKLNTVCAHFLDRGFLSARRPPLWPFHGQRLSIRMEGQPMWPSLRQRLSVCTEGHPMWPSQTEALCPSDRGSLSLRQRHPVPQTETPCPSDRGSLSV